MKRLIALLILVLSSASYAFPAPDISEAMNCAVTVADSFGWEYELKDDGIVIVHAFWKKKPVTLGMRFFIKNGDIYIASVVESETYVFMRKGHKKIEKKFYKALAKENKRRGLVVYGSLDFDAALHHAMPEQ